MCCFFPSKALAVPEFWRESAYAIECKNTPITEVLSDFSESFSVMVVFSERISGVCNGWKRADDIVAFLNHISIEYQLQWFYYKNRLYISTSSDYKTKRIEAASGFRNALVGLGLFQEKFGWGEIEDEGVVIISGPTQYVDFIANISEQEKQIKKREKRKKEKEKEGKKANIFTFPLKHASISDRTVTVRDEQVVIPGVANILKKLLEPSGSHPSMPESIAELPKLNKEVLQVAQDRGIPTLEERFKAAQKEESEINGVVSVEGDVRTNTIFIRSKKNDYDYYKNIIDSLDIPGNLIEIDAIIVDINRENLSELGVNFLYSDNIDNAKATVTSLSTEVLSTGSTVFIENFDKFYASLRALETDGEASIIANTSILTIDNEPAVIDLSETFYIQNVGERIANVVPVTAGTLLNVTPRALTEEGLEKIKLDIDIEDGNLVLTEGASVPGVKKTTISTKAVIDQNRSLVIGGYHLQKRSHEHSGIPFLKDVPFLGSAFSSKIQRSENQERLFILTPRVSPSHHNPEDYSSTGNAELIASAVEKIRNRWADASRSYLEKTKLLLSGLASGVVPTGYKMETAKTSDDIGFDCSQPGIEYRFDGAQKIIGKGLFAYVGVAINRSDEEMEVLEGSCSGKGLIAVSLFPNTVLDVGHATEIFVVMESARIEGRRRPKAVAGL